MHLTTHDFVAGAREAEGIVVVIDVFRAFSVACYAFAANAGVIYPAGDVEDAWALKEVFPDAMLVGERFGKKLEGFDLGNSPIELLGAELDNRILIHTSHAGTQGLVNAAGDRVFTGALVNAAATARVIAEQAPDRVSLVRMGLHATERTAEDDLCAQYLDSLLGGKAVDMAEKITDLKASPAAARFHDEAKPWSPPEDLELCTKLDQFDFAIECKLDSAQRLCLEVCR